VLPDNSWAAIGGSFVVFTLVVSIFVVFTLVDGSLVVCTVCRGNFVVFTLVGISLVLRTLVVGSSVVYKLMSCIFMVLKLVGSIFVVFTLVGGSFVGGSFVVFTLMDFVATVGVFGVLLFIVRTFVAGGIFMMFALVVSSSLVFTLVDGNFVVFTPVGGSLAVLVFDWVETPVQLAVSGDLLESFRAAGCVAIPWALARLGPGTRARSVSCSSRGAPPSTWKLSFPLCARSSPSAQLVLVGHTFGEPREGESSDRARSAWLESLSSHRWPTLPRGGVQQHQGVLDHRAAVPSATGGRGSPPEPILVLNIVQPVLAERNHASRTDSLVLQTGLFGDGARRFNSIAFYLILLLWGAVRVHRRLCVSSNFSL
jgi:hypothetical protein